MKGTIFTDDNILLVTDRNKTETRRLMKVRGGKTKYGDYKITSAVHHSRGRARVLVSDQHNKTHVDFADCWYKVGETLYLRESFCKNTGVYRIDIPEKDRDDPKYKWSRKWYCPENKARFFIKIDKIWIEKLHSINEESAINEGCFSQDPVMEYFDLWRTIHRKHGTLMMDNPYVWPIKFHLK